MALNPYRNPYNYISRKELDMRKEMSYLLYGSTQEIPKGRLGILKRMRRDNDGKLLRCVCRDRVNDEPDKDTPCPYCFGYGYYWDEVWIVYFRNDDSFRKTEGYYKEFEGDIFYVEHNVTVRDEDYIVTLKLDSEGNVIIPVERDKHFKVLSADPFRSDYGRIEFYGIRTIEERPWSTWYGVSLRK